MTINLSSLISILFYIRLFATFKVSTEKSAKNFSGFRDESDGFKRKLFLVERESFQALNVSKGEMRKS